MKTTFLVAKIMVLCLLGVAQYASASLTVREKNITQVYVRNACHEVLDVNIEYIPAGGSSFRTTNYIFSPGEKGHLVDTENLYVYSELTPYSRNAQL